MKRFKYRLADAFYPLAHRYWKWLPLRVKVFFFLNCDLIN
jgi:hypothetical protein